jgi:hypothetical protein
MDQRNESDDDGGHGQDRAGKDGQEFAHGMTPEDTGPRNHEGAAGSNTRRREDTGNAG